VTETSKPQDNTVIIMDTSKGAITIELDAARAPVTVANILTYVDEKFYDGTIFHRIIPDFMIQGGGFTPEMQQKSTRANIENEAANGLKNKQGTLAMARTPDPHSASSQFFINLKDNDFLDYTASTPQGFGYCVFGRVIDGTDLVDEIAQVGTGRHGSHGDVPTEAVIIKTVRRKSAE
jgi:peptidyl-prolyl cis-trans isomerase B (cyclophilin B)